MSPEESIGATRSSKDLEGAGRNQEVLAGVCMSPNKPTGARRSSQELPEAFRSLQETSGAF